MEAIRKQLMAGDGKLDKKAYKFAVEAELRRLFLQLIFLTIMSFLVACVLFISLYFDIKNADQYKKEALEATSSVAGHVASHVVAKAAGAK